MGSPASLYYYSFFPPPISHLHEKKGRENQQQNYISRGLRVRIGATQQHWVVMNLRAALE